MVKATAQPWLYSYASTADMCVKCLRWVVPIPCWSSSINNTSRCKYITSISYSLKSKGCQNCITMLVVHAALFKICLFVWWNNDSKILPQLCPHIFECYQFCFCRHHTGTDFLPDHKAVRYLLKQKPKKSTTSKFNTENERNEYLLCSPTKNNRKTSLRKKPLNQGSLYMIIMCPLYLKSDIV